MADIQELSADDLTLVAYAQKIVAVGSGDRGPMAPCGRCRQVLFDYHPKVRVILPIEADRQGIRSVPIGELVPYGGRWDPESGTQPFEP